MNYASNEYVAWLLSVSGTVLRSKYYDNPKKDFSRQEHQIDVLYISFNAYDAQVLTIFIF